MKDMFDMLSGTSTGSIMSAGFSLADDQGNPEYWASDIKAVYIDNADQIFLINGFGYFTTVLIWLVYFTCFGSWFFVVGHYKYDNPNIHRA